MAIAFVKKTPIGQTSNVASSCTASFGTLPSAGNAILLTVAHYAFDSVHGAAISDNQGNSYSLLIERTNAEYKVAVYAAYNIGSPSGTFTVTYNPDSAHSVQYISMAAAEFSGMGTGTVDQTATNTTTSPTDATVGPTGSTVDAEELVIAITSPKAVDATMNYTVPSGYTEIIKENNNSTLMAMESAYKITSSAGTQSATWTHDASDTQAAIVAVRASAAGAAATPRKALLGVGI